MLLDVVSVFDIYTTEQEVPTFYEIQMIIKFVSKQ
jgi:hypothetical protein